MDGDSQRSSSQTEPSVSRRHGRLMRGLRARALKLQIALRQKLRRMLPNESQHLLALTLLVGVVCGVAAVAFHLAIRAAEELLIERAITAPGSQWVVWTILTPTLGGLLAGACLTWLVPGARGSGIPQVKVAFATEGGRIRFRDALGKFLIGSLQIGSGASLGREGPTVQICAGAASGLARMTGLPTRNMRRLTPVGVAAGIAAAFNAPIAAVTFTIEEIVGALDQTVLSGVVVAAALAAMIERSVLGVHPIFEVQQRYGLTHPSALLTYALLGVAAAFVSIAFTDGLLKVRMWFRRLHVIPAWAHPALGGLVTGVLAVLVLQLLHVTGVTGGGYETLSLALAGKLGLQALVALCAVKVIATVFSYSSGGAGGVFAPALFMGAMLGGAFGHADIALFGAAHEQLGAFALVGMGAVFAGVIRAPITSVLIIFEMTGSYGLVLPLMLANTIAYVLSRRLRPEPIYEALLAQDGIHLPVRTAPARAQGGEELASISKGAKLITGDLLEHTEVVDGSALLEDISRTHHASLDLVVRLSDNEHGVLLAQERSARARLDGALTAAQLAHPAPVVSSQLALLELARTLRSAGAHWAIVHLPDAATPVGIVTREAVAEALLQWYAGPAHQKDGNQG